MNQIVRKKGSPQLPIRARGDRLFQEIPPSELGAVMKAAFQSNEGSGGESLFRAVLDHYEISHLTQQIRDRLLKIKARYLDLTP